MSARIVLDVADSVIMSDYAELKSAYKVAVKHNASIKAVYRIIHRSGLFENGFIRYRKDLEKFPRETQELIRKEYDSGEVCGRLAKKYGCSIWTIRQSIFRCGGSIRPPKGGQKKPIPQDKIEEICQLYNCGQSQTQIADQFGYCQNRVSEVLRDAGVETRRRNKNKHWKSNGVVMCCGNCWSHNIISVPMNREL